MGQTLTKSQKSQKSISGFLKTESAIPIFGRWSFKNKFL